MLVQVTSDPRAGNFTLVHSYVVTMAATNGTEHGHSLLGQQSNLGHFLW